MHWIPILSLAIRAIATGWSVILLVRWRDRQEARLYLATVCALLCALALHQTVALWTVHDVSVSATTADLVALVVSLLMLQTVFFLDRIMTQQARTEMLATVFSASPDAIVLSSLPSGKIVEANEGMTRIIGYRPEEVIGHTPQELRLWADHAEREQIMEQLDRDGEVRNLGLRLRHKAGHVLDCLLTAEVIELAGRTLALSILRDITNRQQAEEALRISEEMFSKAFSASPDAITVSSLKEGTFIEVNESFTRITGYSRDEALGQTSVDLGLWTHQADRDRFRAAVREGERLSSLEITFRHRSGSRVICLVSVDVIVFRGESNLLMTVRDITDRKRAEEERAQLIQTLEAKNAELERFAYTLSHDLKSPLVTISGFLGLLERDIESGTTERVTSDIIRIRRAADTMSRLVDELLELSRIGRVIHPSEVVPLSELAEAAAELVGGRIAERQVHVEIDPSLPSVFCDRLRLLEVLQNLIDNAVKFMGDQPQPHIEIGKVHQDATDVVFVRDNGLGIEPRYQEKIFGLFDRLHPEIEGTGVGLALVKRIVEVHGGRIWVESDGPGTGSTFFFTLPGGLSDAG